MRSQVIKKITLLAICLSLLLTACSSGDTTGQVADYGSYGADWATAFVKEVPIRSPYSDGEKKAAELIQKEIKKLGYSYEIQAFSNPADAAQTSQNIIVKVKGDGFRADLDHPDDLAFLKRDPSTDSTYVPGITVDPNAAEATTTKATEPVTEETLPSGVIRREVIFGAHYDTLVSEAKRAEMPDYDGINDNASGVAALLATMKELKKLSTPFDVTFVFFGARYANFQGSLTFATSMAGDAAHVEGAYIVEGIYAGERLYTHAGRNSLKANKKYLMRRKLYELTDIALESNIYEVLGVGVYTNQAGFRVTVPGYGEGHLYREFTLNDGDYLPFDSIDIPSVFIQAGNYTGKTLEDLKESTLPVFHQTNGQVSNTNLDSSAYLEKALPEKELQRRINGVAYLLVTVTQKMIEGLKLA